MKTSSFLLGCVLLFAGFAQAAEKPLLRIGARVFTEQTLLAEITSQYLRTKGYDVQVTGGLGSNLARSAHESGQLDMLWEYTGVSLVAYNHVTEKLDSEQSYTRVKELDGKAPPLSGPKRLRRVEADPLISRVVEVLEVIRQ